MIERSAVQSFVVRVYRFVPDERRLVAGVIEAVDGSGTSRPFADTTQLGEVLCNLLTEENRVPKKPGIGRRAP
jgi:hypothetical protein